MSASEQTSSFVAAPSNGREAPKAETPTSAPRCSAYARVARCRSGGPAAISDPPGLAKIADTLSEQAAIGRLGQVCDGMRENAQS